MLVHGNPRYVAALKVLLERAGDGPASRDDPGIAIGYIIVSSCIVL
jgi:hypothetical protein